MPPTSIHFLNYYLIFPYYSSDGCHSVVKTLGYSSALIYFSTVTVGWLCFLKCWYWSSLSDLWMISSVIAVSLVLFCFSYRTHSVLSLQHVYCAILSAFTMGIILYWALHHGIFSFSGSLSRISCFALLFILILLIIFFIVCHCYPFFIMLQHNVVTWCTNGCADLCHVGMIVTHLAGIAERLDDISIEWHWC